MIFDSEQQKNFVLECVRKFPTTYETALQLANTFGQSLQDGRVVDIKDQLAKLPIKIGKVPAQVVKKGKVGSDNGNDSVQKEGAAK